MKILIGCIFMLTLGVGCHAQSEQEVDSIEVVFNVVIPEDNPLTAGQRIEVRQIMDKLLARTGSASPIGKSPFVIIPDVKVTSTDMTSGAKETLVLIEGEFSLIVKNRYDGTAYQETTIPLKEMVEVSNLSSPKDILIKSINPRDRRLVRFIRTAQKRIVEKYEGTSLGVPF